MCDYSLQHTASRPAKAGETLVTHDFGTGTRGFRAADDPTVAVCLLPGTELAFKTEINHWAYTAKPLSGRTARFRQVQKESLHTHHDALEFPDGQIVLLTMLAPGQEAIVLQLPAEARTAEEKREQERVAIVG